MHTVMLLHVVHVEDDDSQRIAMEFVLEKLQAKLGFTFEQAPDISGGRAALQRSSGNVLLLSDRRLPDGDGLELATWARSSLGERVHCIVLSSAIEEGNVSPGVRTVQKPMDLASQTKLVEAEIGNAG